MSTIHLSYLLLTISSLCVLHLIFWYIFLVGYSRVSSKQTKTNFGSNRNKLKQDLFRVCFGLFRETKNKVFRFVSVFRTYIETTATNRTVSKQTETNQKDFQGCCGTDSQRQHSLSKKRHKSRGSICCWRTDESTGLSLL